MGFNMSGEARRYYDKLNQDSVLIKLKEQFDFYYLCLLVGFANKKINEDTGTEFVRRFPSSYNSQSKEIIGALISAEISRKGINLENRKRIQELILTMVDPDSPTKLSNLGEELMNKYAQGGFLLIKERVGQSHDVDTFLVRYHDEIISTSAE